jgi:hypothetical protein
MSEQNRAGDTVDLNIETTWLQKGDFTFKKSDKVKDVLREIAWFFGREDSENLRLIREQRELNPLRSLADHEIESGETLVVKDAG